MNKPRTFLFFLGIVILAILIYFVFPGKILLPQFFQILGWQIRIYGLLLGVAVLASYELARRHAKAHQLPEEQIDNIAIVLIGSGLIGARLYHVFSSWEYYLANPVAILLIWQGGLSIFGAVIGGVIGLWIYLRTIKLGIPLAKVLDWLTPSLVLGQIIGRFGNLFNYEAYGLPTQLPWKMFVPTEFRLAPYLAAEFFHPLFLYESLGSLLILVILLNFSKLTSRFNWLEFPGARIWLWVGLYGILRLGTESLRVDSPYFLGLKQNLLVAILMITTSCGVLFWHRFHLNNYESKSS